LDGLLLLLQAPPEFSEFVPLGPFLGRDPLAGQRQGTEGEATQEEAGTIDGERHEGQGRREATPDDQEGKPLKGEPQERQRHETGSQGHREE
jgi:hypothetical protein